MKDEKNLKDIFFSANPEFNQIQKLNNIDKTPQILNDIRSQMDQNKNFSLLNKVGEKSNLLLKNKNNSINNKYQVEFLNKMILTFTKERDLTREFYEKFPYKLSQLISIVHFSIYIYYLNKNSLKFNQDLNDIFSKFFVLTMKKLNLIENILSINNSKDSARFKINQKYISNVNNENKITSTIQNLSQICKEKITNEKIAEDKRSKKENKEITRNENVFIQKNVIDIDKTTKDINNKALNYLAKFTSIRNTKLKQSAFLPIEKKEIKSKFIESNLLIKNENKEKEITIGDNINIEEEKIIKNLSNKASRNPYLNPKNIKSSNELLQSISKRDELLLPIKERDRIKKNEKNLSSNRIKKEINNNIQSEDPRINKIEIPNPNNNMFTDKNYEKFKNAEYTNIPKTYRVMKKESLKDFCEMLDLTKSKLQTRRVLNKNENSNNVNASKALLQTFASKKNNDISRPCDIEVNKHICIPNKNIVKMVSSELKNLTKYPTTKREDTLSKNNIKKEFFQIKSSNTLIKNEEKETKNNCNKIDISYKLNIPSLDSSDYKNIPQCNKNDIHENSNKYPKLDDMKILNSSTNIRNSYTVLLNKIDISLTPNDKNTKNNSIFKRSLFDKTPSPDIILKKKQNQNIKLDSDKKFPNQKFFKYCSKSMISQKPSLLKTRNKINKENIKDGYFYNNHDSISSYLSRKPKSLEVKSCINYRKNSIIYLKRENIININFSTYDNLNMKNCKNANDQNFTNESILSPSYDYKINKFKLSNKLKKLNSLKLENFDINKEITINNMSMDDTDDYCTGYIKLLLEEKQSEISINFEFDSQIRNLDSEININTIRDLESSYKKNLSFDSETDFKNNCSRNNIKDESLVNNKLDEVDSQFDEMIELMDDIQISDKYRDFESDVSLKEAKPNAIKISDFKLISEISKGGYGRVDIFKKISTGDIYAIKTVDINKMVFLLIYF